MYSLKEKSRSLTYFKAHIATDTLYSLLLDIAKKYIIKKTFGIGVLPFLV
jgi:hypothetical protein